MEGSKSELDLFSRANLQTSIKESGFYKVEPLQKYNPSSGSIEFLITSQNGRYLDLSSTFLEAVCRLVNAEDESDPPPMHRAFPENNALHSLFSNIDLWLNEVKVSSSNNLYPYKAYITNVLSHDMNLKKSMLVNEGFIPNYNEWKGAEKYLSSKKRITEYCGVPHLDLFFQERLIPPGVSIRLRLQHSTAGFSTFVDALKKSSDIDDKEENEDSESISDKEL